MWKTLKKIMAALAASVSLVGGAFEQLMRELAELRNRFARRFGIAASLPDMSRITEAQRAIEDFIDKPSAEAPEPRRRSPEATAELGALVKLGVERFRTGGSLWDLYLLEEIELFLRSLTHEEMRLVERASDHSVGQHVSGTPSIAGHGGEFLRLPDPVRDGERAADLEAIRLERETAERELQEKIESDWIANYNDRMIDEYFENGDVQKPIPWTDCLKAA
jgi:hypothetical protein